MAKKIKIYRNHLGLSFLAALLAMFLPIAAAAFPVEFYRPSSALAQGKWVKIKVESSGMYRLPAATLAQWGFNDPSKVRVHGYGGRRLDDLLSESTYIDDLPETPSEYVDGSVVFYAAGPESWEASSGSNYHGVLNLYSEAGYYFVTESDAPAAKPVETGRVEVKMPLTTAQGRYHYESEQRQATTAGPLFTGEDFQYTRTKTFSIPTPGRSPDTEVWMECVFVHTHLGSTANLKFKVDNASLPEVSSDALPATSSSSYAHASVGTTRHSFTPGSPAGFTLSMTYEPRLSNPKAALDYLSFNYVRDLSLPAEGYMSFWSDAHALSFADSPGLRIWDVTDLSAIASVVAATKEGRKEWAPTEAGMRSYVAWKPGASMPVPTFLGNVLNQDIHGTAYAADMVIITPIELLGPANRIAELHRSEDGMVVEVIDHEKIYNEFSSGTYDVGGLRKYLKYIYDLSADTDTPLKYVLLLGRATLDHRNILASKIVNYRTTPWWVVREPRLSMTDNDGFGTDDFIAMLDDNTGRSMGLDPLSVAVGRIPMLTAAEGDEIVDKLYQYIGKSKKTGWKNRMVVLADDGDAAEHLKQAENMVALMAETELNNNILDKIYIDAYEKVGNVCIDARREMYRMIDEGVAWWIFTGHASDHGWTGEGMLDFTDINSMYLTNLPFILASTCNFLRWDGSTISGGEIMYKERNGGCISMISATRPVYISDNGLFLKAFGRQALSRDDDGMLVRSGEAYRRTKNDIRNNSGNITSNSNRLRFVFMGDPAMALVTPSNYIEITSINGLEPGGDDQIVLGALSIPVIEGRVLTPAGEVMTDFNGIISLDIYDADYSTTTLGREDGVTAVYDRHGKKLFSGSTTVADGVFSIKVPMPSQVADNFREATMSLYAYATNSNEEAVGLFRDFYVYGFEEPTSPDTTAPVISSLVLNHDGFASGDVVNSAPLVIARIEDNIGLNLSAAGVGQQMTLTLDGFTALNDVSSFFIPATDGSASGVINYPLEGLAEGAHTLKLRVFDTSGNTSAREIEFFVSDKVSPKIFELYTDANPASTSASFYVRHDRANTYMDVTVTVYNLMGQPVWSGTSRGISDMNVSLPVTWNLCDSAGRRVQRGIYLYRASISTDDEHYESASQRIAVTAPM